jgi:hypothetical protein
MPTLREDLPLAYITGPPETLLDGLQKCCRQKNHTGMLWLRTAHHDLGIAIGEKIRKEILLKIL